MSMLFNTNNYVYVPYNAALNTVAKALTLSCWVNIANATAMMMFVNRMVAGTGGYEWWSINTLNGYLRGLIGNASSVPAVQNATLMPANVWTHCALTYDGTTLSLYQGGVLVATAASSISLASTDTTGIVIGANAQSAGDTNIQEFTVGYIEDMRMYTRALTAGEIQTICASDGRDFICDNLLFRFPMDEYQDGALASGADSVRDIGPYGMHGTPNGSCYYGPGLHNMKRFVSI